MKILFLYPNTLLTNRIPLNISVLSACLKRYDHEVDLFDTTFYKYQDSVSDDSERENTLQVKRVDLSRYGVIWEQADIYEKLKNKIAEFQPDLIALSCVENTYELGMSLLEEAKKYGLFTIVGGCRVIASPEDVIRNKSVDAICVGEGEKAIVEIANRLENKESISDVKNLWVKDKNGKISKNEIDTLISLEELPLPDWDLFDKRHLYRPLDGIVYRTGSFELSRGCPYKCTYCINERMIELYRGKGKYHREKSVEKAIAEMRLYKDKYNLELISFVDESFTLMIDKRFIEFCDIYKKEINLPYSIQTRPEIINDFKAKKLKESGCINVSMGIESGNENMRSHLLSRKMTNESIIKSIKTIKKYGMRVSSTNMIGLPEETRENIFETIEINRKAQPDSATVSIFYPYKGTRLREISIEKGYLRGDEEGKGLRIGSILNMPQLPKDEIKRLQKTFQLYYKLPKVMYPIINLSEKNTKLGGQIYSLLAKVLKYFD